MRPSAFIAVVAAASFTLSISSTVLAADQDLMTVPTEGPYKAVSSLVALPDFIPGLGQLFVDPDTLPVGPFLAYDRDGKLVSTVYMVPLSMMTPDMTLDNLVAPAGSVDHVDMMYNAGHPGVEEPHIHVTLWNVSVDEESRVAQ